MQRTHIDLFTGLAGFSLAARANGVRTIAMCEADARCQAFLAKAWPGVPVWPDVRTFGVGNPASAGAPAKEQSGQSHDHGGAINGSQHMADAKRAKRRPQTEVANEHDRNDRGRQEAASGHPFYSQAVWLLTAGVPCQPASRAGKQAGENDHRWLWPQTVTLLGHIQPTWAILENPPGIGDMEFTRILSDVEAQGYDFPRTIDGTPIIHSIGACALGAPHRRMRYWIVCRRLGNTNEAGLEGLLPGRGNGRGGGKVAEATTSRLAHTPQLGQRERGSAPGGTGHADQCGQGGVAITRQEHGMPGPTCGGEDGRASRQGERLDSPWGNYVWLPCADGKIRRAPDDSFRLVDGLHRSVLGALGNSIVWPVAAKIIAAMIQAEA